MPKPALVQTTSNQQLLDSLREGFATYREGLISAYHMRDEELKGTVALAYRCLMLIKSDPLLTSGFASELKNVGGVGYYNQVLNAFLGFEPTRGRTPRQREDQNAVYERRDLMAAGIEWLVLNSHQVKMPPQQAQVIALLDSPHIDGIGGEWPGGLAGKLREVRAIKRRYAEAEALTRMQTQNAARQSAQEAAYDALVQEAAAHGKSPEEWQVIIAAQDEAKRIKEKEPDIIKRLEGLAQYAPVVGKVVDEYAVYIRVNGKTHKLNDMQRAQYFG